MREAIRAKEPAYRERRLDDLSLDDEALLDAMQAEPVLINRPFVRTAMGTRAVPALGGRAADPAAAGDAVLQRGRRTRRVNPCRRASAPMLSWESPSGLKPLLQWDRRHQGLRRHAVARQRFDP